MIKTFLAATVLNCNTEFLHWIVRKLTNQDCNYILKSYKKRLPILNLFPAQEDKKLANGGNMTVLDPGRGGFHLIHPIKCVPYLSDF